MTRKEKSILIVDDDSRNIFALKATLVARGYTVLFAHGMREALVKLDTDDEVGLVLLDMMMPDMDGYEGLAEIKNNLRLSLPVIAVTAQAMTGDRDKCIAAGADDYLIKPIDVDALIKMIAKHLHHDKG